MPDLICPNCRSSASLPLGVTCNNHQPVPVTSAADAPLLVEIAVLREALRRIVMDLDGEGCFTEDCACSIAHGRRVLAAARPVVGLDPSDAQIIDALITGRSDPAVNALVARISGAAPSGAAKAEQASSAVTRHFTCCGKRYWLWPGDRSATCGLSLNHVESCGPAVPAEQPETTEPEALWCPWWHRDCVEGCVKHGGCKDFRTPSSGGSQ